MAQVHVLLPPNQLKFIFYHTYMTILKNENACHEKTQILRHFCKQSNGGFSPSEKEEKRFKLEQVFLGQESTHTKSGGGPGAVIWELAEEQHLSSWGLQALLPRTSTNRAVGAVGFSQRVKLGNVECSLQNMEYLPGEKEVVGLDGEVA